MEARAVQVGEAGTLRVQVEGEVIRPGKVAVRDLTRLGTLVQSGIERVARVLTGEPGPALESLPRSLRRATELLLTGIEPGSAILVLELPAPEDLEMSPDERLFEPPAPDVGFRAVDRFVRGLHQLEDGLEQVPEGWDNSVMEIAENLAELTRTRGIAITLRAAVPAARPSMARIAPDLAPRFAVRHATIRRRRAARGELIAVDLRRGRIDVEDATGRRVQCQFDPEAPALMASVKQLVGQVVLVSGEEEFDVVLNRTGKLEVQALQPAGEEIPLHETFWQNRSVAEQAREQRAEPLRSLHELLPSEAFTDEELDAFVQALRELRRPE